MAWREQTERYGGAAFLGIPAFDGFVWMLDNWARMELLVRLRSYLPPFLVNPGTAFICTCTGLWLLYLSHARQLRRVGEGSRSKLVDTSGTEYQSIEKPGWLIPVAIVFGLALVATPILAIGFSFAYKGNPPSARSTPRPPYFAYFKTPPMKAAPRTLSPPPIQIAPGGINIGKDNRGTAIVNNLGPPSRRIPAAVRADVIAVLKRKPGKITINYIMGDEPYQFATDMYEVLQAAGWNIVGMRAVMLDKPWKGAMVRFHVKEKLNLPDRARVDVPDDSLAGNPYRRANGSKYQGGNSSTDPG